MSDAETFRKETHEWLDANCPPSMRWSEGEAANPTLGGDVLTWGGRKETFPNPETKQWLDLMAEKGWTAPTWPEECGGGGLSKADAKILAQEMRRLRVKPPLVGFGLTMIGPLILEHGTEEQKLRFLPEICRGEIRWCQGYSEPGAGSDLANVQTKAVVDGDEYVLNGQKVWTSYADASDCMFFIARTDTEASKHAGISFLLVDMDQPGVTVQPIKLISGYSPFCETFLEDVRTSRDHVIGGEGNGWAMAKALLGHERSMISEAFNEGENRNQLVDLAREYLGCDEGGRVGDAVIRDQIAQLTMNKACLDLTLARTKEGMKLGHQPGAESSIFKYYATELNKDRSALSVGILGPQGCGWEGDGFTDEEAELTRTWLRARGNSIEGGTSEIQLNIIAKRVLGLPD